LASPIPLNITLFARLTGSKPGEQLATSGPYSDALSGVVLRNTRLEAGVYLLVLSAWEAGSGLKSGWEVRCWADTGFEIERTQ
jgi:calpain-7